MVGIEVVGDDGGRSVLAVCGTEGVHHIAVSIAGESLGELLLAGLHGLLSLVVLGSTLLNTYGLAFFLRIEAQVLEQQSLTHLQGSSLLLSLSAVGSEGYGNTKGLGHSVLDLTKRELRVHLSFGLTHVAHDDESTTVGQHLLQGGQSAANAGVVRDLTILIEGHVEVNAHDCLLSGKIKFVDCHN